MVRFVILLQMAACAMALASLGIVNMKIALLSAKQLVYFYLLLQFLRFLVFICRQPRKRKRSRARQRRK